MMTLIGFESVAQRTSKWITTTFLWLPSFRLLTKAKHADKMKKATNRSFLADIQATTSDWAGCRAKMDTIKKHFKAPAPRLLARKITITPLAE